MNPTLPLWIVSAATLTEPMSVPDAVGDLSRFSARWSVEFSEVRREDDTFGARADAEQSESVRRIEALLVAAKTAIGALRTSEADGALAEAESLVRSHAELPQAAWLLADLYATQKELVESENPVLGREFARRAAILEGEREVAFRDAPAADISFQVPPARELSLGGVSPRERVEWDGDVVPLRFEGRPGEHHVRVLRGERLVWAGWVSVGEATTIVDLPVPTLVACSADDLSGTLDGNPAPRPRVETACRDWAAARVRNGQLELARCRGAFCGDWERAKRQPVGTAAASPKPKPKPEAARLPRWFSYAAIGAGTALVAGFVVVASGAFGSSDPTRERWVYAGFK